MEIIAFIVGMLFFGIAAFSMAKIIASVIAVFKGEGCLVHDFYDTGRRKGQLA